MDVLKDDTDCAYGDDEQASVAGDESVSAATCGSGSGSGKGSSIAHNRRIIGKIRAQGAVQSTDAAGFGGGDGDGDGDAGDSAFEGSKPNSGENSRRKRRGSSADGDMDFDPDIIDEDEEDDAAADTRSSPPRLISNDDFAASVNEMNEMNDKEDVESGSDVSDEDVSDSESLATSDAVLKGTRGRATTQQSELVDPLDQVIRASSSGAPAAAAAGGSGGGGMGGVGSGVPGMHSLYSADLAMKNMSGSSSARAAHDKPLAPSGGGSERLRGKSISIINTGRNVINGGSNVGGIAARDNAADGGFGSQRKMHTVPDNFLSVSTSGKTKSFSKGSNFVGTSMDMSHSYLYKLDTGGGDGVTGADGLKDSLSIISSGSLSSMALAAGPFSDRAAGSRSNWHISAAHADSGASVGTTAAGDGIGIYFDRTGDSDRRATDKLVASALAAADDAITAGEEASVDGLRVRGALPRSSSVEQLSELSHHGVDSP